MIPPTLMTARRRRCALAAIAVCLGTSIASVGPAQATPQSAVSQAQARAVAAKQADGAQANDADPAKNPLPAPPEPAAAVASAWASSRAITPSKSGPSPARIWSTKRGSVSSTWEAQRILMRSGTPTHPRVHFTGSTRAGRRFTLRLSHV